MRLPTASAKPFVLVVDGNAYRGLELVAELRSAGCRVSWAPMGSDALRYILWNGPDAVIADWFLPDTTGPELARRIKSNPFAPKVILGRDQVDWRDLREAFEAAADDVLPRPLSMDALLESLERQDSWTGRPCESSTVVSA